MCDKRIIKKIKLNDGREIEITTIKSISPKLMSKIRDEGLYRIEASGSGYLYFNGKEWLRENNSNGYNELKQGFDVLDYVISKNGDMEYLSDEDNKIIEKRLKELGYL